MWSYALKRHHTLRVTDIESGANVGAMLYNLNHSLDRLNLPDTLKAQHTAKLTTGNVLLSDMGHVLCSISADTCGWHDPLAGHSTASAGPGEIRTIELPGKTQRLSPKRSRPIPYRAWQMGTGKDGLGSEHKLF